MKSRIIATFLVLGGCATFVGAQTNLREAAARAVDQNRNDPQGRETALKALEHHYGAGVAVKITGERDVNGIHVYDAEASRNGGSAPASATGQGFVIESGLPEGAANMPAAVRDVTQGLFHASPTDVDIIDRHYYFAQAATGGHEYVVMMDATGRVIAIDSPQRLREIATESDRSAGNAEKQQIGKMVQRRFPEAEARDIRTAHEFPGYYVAYLTNKTGSGWAILDTRDDLVSYRLPRGQSTFPEPVQRAIATVLKGDQIQNAGIGIERMFRVRQNVGNEEFTLLVRANGEIQQVGEQRERGAATASHRIR